MGTVIGLCWLCIAALYTAAVFKAWHGGGDDFDP